MTESRRWCVHQVPHKPLKSSLGWQDLRRPEPVRRNLEGFFVDWLYFVCARISAYEFILTIEDLKGHWSVSIGGKVIIDYCSVRWILPDRLFRRQRRI